MGKARENIKRSKAKRINSLEEQFDNLNIQNVVPRLETEIFDKMMNFPLNKSDNQKQDAKALDKWNNLHKAAVLFQRILRGRAIQV